MPYDISTSCELRAAPRGWYRDESGQLRYWDGRAWARTQSGTRAARKSEGPSTPRWRRVTLALGWIVSILCLGMLLSGASAAGVDCGTVLSPRVGPVDSAHTACAEALESRAAAIGVTGLAALLCFTASPWTAARITGSRWGRTTPAVAFC